MKLNSKANERNASLIQIDIKKINVDYLCDINNEIDLYSATVKNGDNEILFKDIRCNLSVLFSTVFLMMDSFAEDYRGVKT